MFGAIQPALPEAFRSSNLPGRPDGLVARSAFSRTASTEFSPDALVKEFKLLRASEESNHQGLYVRVL